MKDTIQLLQKTERENNDLKIRIFPNPFIEFVTIDIQNNVKKLKCELFNFMGEKIKQFDVISSYPNTIGLTDISAGFYILKFLDNQCKVLKVLYLAKK